MRSFGTVIQEHAAPRVESLSSQATLDRFADVVAYASGTMPEVLVCHRYRLDDAEVLTLNSGNGRVTVYEPSTRTVDDIALRAFARRSAPVGRADWNDLRVPTLALELALACDIPVGITEVETVQAVIDAVGAEAGEAYLDALCFGDGEVAMDVYASGDLDRMLTDAVVFTREWQAEEAEKAEATAAGRESGEV